MTMYTMNIPDGIMSLVGQFVIPGDPNVTIIGATLRLVGFTK